MSDYYCEEHRYNPPLNSVLRFCPYCLGAEAPAPEADSTSESSLKFQDGICHDCESPDLCIQDNGCHNTGKVFSRIDHPSQQWQPIETAPELEWVLVPHEGRSVEARYELSNDGVMCWFQPRHNRSMEPKPTHWMPLPAPPMSDK